MHSPL